MSRFYLPNFAHPFWPFLMLLVAFILRLSVFGEVVQTGGDSELYLTWALWLSQGDFQGLARFPLHHGYVLSLIPMELLNLDKALYIKILHLSLSTGTVWFLFLCARRLFPPRTALLIGVVAVVYPYPLYWMPFITSYPFFLFILSLFLLTLLRLVEEMTLMRLLVFGFVSILLFISRPVGVPLIVIAFMTLLVHRFFGQLGWQKAVKAAIGFFLVLLLLAVTTVALSSTIKHWLSSNPVIADGFWYSTRIVTSNKAEIMRVLKEESPEAMRESQKKGVDIYVYKTQMATTFIREHPFKYIAMTGKRFTSFWFPWIFAKDWSLSHRLLDGAISLFFVPGTLFLLWKSTADRIRDYWVLLSMAISLGVLTAFSQIDIDGLYRMPADVILILLAPAGWLRFWTGINPRIPVLDRHPNLL